MFAATKSQGPGFGNLDFLRHKLGAFMGAVAEGLSFRLPAGTPIIGAGLKRFDIGRFLGGRGRAHGRFLTLRILDGKCQWGA